MKDGMSGILQQVRLGQVRKAIKSSIIWPFLLSISIFQNSEKNRQIRGHLGGVRWWKNWLRGQVRKAIKSWKSEARGPPIHSLTCFGWKFERTVFERTTYLNQDLGSVPNVINTFLAKLKIIIKGQSLTRKLERKCFYHL
jgi:hypothetical protein